MSDRVCFFKIQSRILGYSKEASVFLAGNVKSAGKRKKGFTQKKVSDDLSRVKTLSISPISPAMPPSRGRGGRRTGRKDPRSKRDAFKSARIEDELEECVCLTGNMDWLY